MDILNHLQTPNKDRDVQWEYKFLDLLPHTKLQILSEDPQIGPDSWPYLMVSTKEIDGSTLPVEPAHKVLHWLSTKGIGLVVNPTQEYPDFVFNFGMIWNYRERGLFIQSNQNQAPIGNVEINQGQKILAGEPTQYYLPSYVRAILRDFFRDQGIIRPRIAVISQDKTIYDLAFSLESLGNPPASEHEGIAEAISWFLPPHYSVLLISEAGLPFSDL